MNCPECDEKYLDYLYGELPAAEKRAMEDHLGACEYCAKQLSHLQLIRTAFKRMEHEPRALVHQRILAHARDSFLEEKKSWLAQFLFKPATALAAVVMVAAGMYVYTQYPPATLTDRQQIASRQESRQPSRSAEPGNMLVADARAPIQGVFYRRPSPDRPAFVEEGSPVQAGVVLGLVEVMKCFNQVTYGGADLPPKGRVERMFLRYCRARIVREGVDC